MSDAGGAGGAGGADDAPTARALCERFCAVDAILTASMPCNPGDLVVRNVVVQRGEGGANALPDPDAEPPDTPAEPSCVDSCFDALSRGGSRCEPTFAAMTSCWEEAIWVCVEYYLDRVRIGVWETHDCNVQSAATNECLAE